MQTVAELREIEVSYTAACAVRETGDNTDRLAVFLSPTDTDDEFLKALMQKIRNNVVERIGLNPDYLIPVSQEAIPKTAIGKIQRQELAKRFQGGEFDTVINNKRS